MLVCPCALVGAFSMIVKTNCETNGSSVALIRTLSSIYMSRVETSTPATGEAGHLWCLQSTEDIWRWSNGWWTEGQTSTSVTTEAGHLWWWQPARATWTLYCVSSKRLFLILIIIQWLFVNIRCTLHIRVMYRPMFFYMCCDIYYPIKRLRSLLVIEYYFMFFLVFLEILKQF